MADSRNVRLDKLLELERRGVIKPEHKAELEMYRRQGLAKPLASGETGGSETTEGERTAAFLTTRLVGALSDISAATGENPDAARPALGAMVAGVFGDEARNAVNSPERQRVEAAQLDALDAALTLGTGAAYTREQLEGYRKSYFPLLTDDATTVADKRERFLRLIEAAKVKSGAAAPQIDEALAAFQKPESARIKDPREDVGIQQALEAEINKAAGLDGGPNIEVDITPNDAPPGAPPAPQRGGGGFMEGADAFVRGAADTLTLGFADEFAAAGDTIFRGGTMADNLNNQRATDTFDERNHPYLRMGGQVAGVVGGGLGLARAAPGMTAALNSGGRGARLAKGAAAESIYGAGYGLGSGDDGNRVANAGVNALAAPVGGLVGKAGVKAASRVLSPAVDPAVRVLRDAGVRLTPGQALGGGWNRAESKLQALPLVGDMIRSGRKRSVADLQTAGINQALAPLGKQLPKGMKGTRAQAFAQEAFNRAYDDARSGMRFVPDQEFVTAVNDLSQRVAGGELDEAAARRLSAIFKSRVARRIAAGPVGGDAYKKMVSELKKIAQSSRQKDPEFSDSVNELVDHIDGAARRNSPPEFVAKMAKADEGYSQFVIIEGAAARRGGATGEFTPGQLDAEVQKQSGGVRSKRYLRGDARMQELSDAAKEILPEGIPDSGTPERLMMNAGVLGGGVVASPPALAGYSALGAPYLPGVRDAVTNALVGQRPQAVDAFGRALRDRGYIGNALGVPFALDWAGN